MVKTLSLLTISFSILSACSHAPQKVNATFSSPSAMASSKSNSKTSKGMTSIAPNIYVDADMPTGQRKQLLQIVKYSTFEIKKFFGGMKSSPNIYACSTKKCFKKFGGISAEAKTINDDTVLLSYKGLNKTTVTHELAHAELNKRLGKSHWNKTPMWFDEGLAAYICKNPKYAKTVPSMPLSKLTSHNQWVNAVHDKKPVYNVARQAFEGWYKGVGTEGLKDLIARLKKGENLSFDKEINSVNQYSKL